MGGVWVDKDGRTSMPELYAAGETACNGVHGKNRLASNSLLESLVWGRRAAWCMRTGESLAVEQAGEPALDGVIAPWAPRPLQSMIWPVRPARRPWRSRP